MADLPKKYNHKGLFTDRKAPFVVRGTTRIELPAGEYRFLVRSRSATRLVLDDKIVAETKFREPSGDGHGSIPELAAAHEPGLAELPPENQERLVTLTLDGGSHTFRVETIVGDQKLRPELGELSVSVACTCDAPSIEGEPTFKLLRPNRRCHWARQPGQLTSEMSAPGSQSWTQPRVPRRVATKPLIGSDATQSRTM